MLIISSIIYEKKNITIYFCNMHENYNKQKFFNMKKAMTNYRKPRLNLNPFTQHHNLKQDHNVCKKKLKNNLI